MFLEREFEEREEKFEMRREREDAGLIKCLPVIDYQPVVIDYHCPKVGNRLHKL